MRIYTVHVIVKIRSEVQGEFLNIIAMETFMGAATRIKVKILSIHCPMLILLASHVLIKLSKTNCLTLVSMFSCSSKNLQ